MNSVQKGLFLIIVFVLMWSKANKATVIRNSNSGNEQTVSPSPLLLLIPASGGVIYSAWKILQSKKRAETMANEYYSGQTGAGQQGDAFRHIFMSMLLRRYLSRPVAWSVMSAYEIVRKNPHARDTYMDYHNNKVGRSAIFKSLPVSDYQAETVFWKEGAETIRDWINKPENGIRLDWNETNPDKKKAKLEEKEIDDGKYIYYKD